MDMLRSTARYHEISTFTTNIAQDHTSYTYQTYSHLSDSTLFFTMIKYNGDGTIGTPLPGSLVLYPNPTNTDGPAALT